MFGESWVWISQIQKKATVLNNYNEINAKIIRYRVFEIIFSRKTLIR